MFRYFILFSIFFLFACGGPNTKLNEQAGTTQVTFHTSFSHPNTTNNLWQMPADLQSDINILTLLTNVVIHARGTIGTGTETKVLEIASGATTGSITLDNGNYAFFAFASTDANFADTGTLKCAQVFYALGGAATNVALNLTSALCPSVAEFGSAKLKVHTCSILPTPSGTGPNCTAPGTNYGSLKLVVANYVSMNGAYNFGSSTTVAKCFAPGTGGAPATTMFNMPLGGTSSPVALIMYAYPSGDSTCSTTVSQQYTLRTGVLDSGGYSPSGCMNKDNDGTYYHLYLNKTGTGC